MAMLTSVVSLILGAVFGFFTFVLLARFYMQWARVSFRNQVGQFVVALTDWIVVPTRRVIPGLFGLDFATLCVAWLAQVLLLMVELGIRGASFYSNTGALIVTILVVGLIETLRTMVYLLFGIVIAAALLSWVSPYSPAAPILNAMTRPFLRPLQRVMPTVANIDLSPLVLLLILQIVLLLLASLRASMLTFAG